MKSSFENSVTAPAGKKDTVWIKVEFDKKAEINFKDGSKAQIENR